MGLARGIEIRYLESIRGGMSEFYTPQSSHETMLVQIPPQTIDDLFVHRRQTDQLLVVRGSFVLVVLHNRQYQYVPLSDRHPVVVTIPPFVPHGAINLSNEPCVLVNAVLRQGEPHPKDYQPMRSPFPYDLSVARSLLADSLPASA
ncbi:dTDP-4-dehydrorhamnose 3,5-epimerase [Desertifilum sp. FACHB-1129]|uniref:dTDP-4-dehydrorhamnose 3,5-epimerase n=2 Tax=Desertifilum tharense IPPAS B-1220 TaxID=1781255 RepID=A0A1E5QRG0_9CYAN|nr:MULTISPECIES: dTDP-4-dehydrorhamnose 3,5-epimerase [unclassified Desertifilum]MCD8488634.1 dTDP-4-dehydrorhamnose 3,5-epimerase [Desertifilum sp.]MDI9638037.1 dTDP-4-dehydrorhamnose 3,5-epimerase [Geitlerinema splendidum]MDL5049827.1 dTDP-4-dehydrorhamnose 3,5-epimerase [Oscillatoria amoena NRMC-F 0135]OEJ77270.1 dTDP-4-dehydrorhamnose 3,5-epimerase [Desertifilum tharense IPPAS B-1220]MBD2314735.1 dTDP-4-dehydrorhamnose 3,5-epimerase [Desertifilum sp. FACHB-1129]